MVRGSSLLFFLKKFVKQSSTSCGQSERADCHRSWPPREFLFLPNPLRASQGPVVLQAWARGCARERPGTEVPQGEFSSQGINSQMCPTQQNRRGLSRHNMGSFGPFPKGACGSAIAVLGSGSFSFSPPRGGRGESSAPRPVLCCVRRSRAL